MKGKIMSEQDHEGTQAQREKFWDECDESEKCARLREEVKGLKKQVKGILMAMDIVDEHDHGADGNMVIPAKAVERMIRRIKHPVDSGDRPDVYF